MDRKYIDEATKLIAKMDDDGRKSEAQNAARFLCVLFATYEKGFNTKKFMRACFPSKHEG